MDLGEDGEGDGDAAAMLWGEAWAWERVRPRREKNLLAEDGSWEAAAAARARWWTRAAARVLISARSCGRPWAVAVETVRKRRELASAKMEGHSGSARRSSRDSEAEFATRRVEAWRAPPRSWEKTEETAWKEAKECGEKRSSTMQGEAAECRRSSRRSCGRISRKRRRGSSREGEGTRARSLREDE